MSVFEEKEVIEWLQRAAKDMFPKMRDSAMCISIWNDKPDPKMCLELGAAMCFDKPIILLVPEGQKNIPANIKRCAFAIVEGDVNDEKTKKELQRVLTSLTSVITQDVA